MNNVYRLFGYAGAALAVFFALRYSLGANDLIMMLNGLFVGSLCSVGVSFYETIRNTVTGKYQYMRVEQMTIAFVLVWAALAIAASSSIYLRMSDLPTTSLTSVAFSRYISIIASILMVTAPDFGLGILHGRDRKFMFASLSIGAIVAIVLILLQVEGVPTL